MPVWLQVSPGGQGTPSSTLATQVAVAVPVVPDVPELEPVPLPALDDEVPVEEAAAAEVVSAVSSVAVKQQAASDIEPAAMTTSFTRLSIRGLPPRGDSGGRLRLSNPRARRLTSVSDVLIDSPS